jgi:hypothetical protein
MDKSCNVAWGAKRAQIGIKPLQRLKNPSFLTVLTAQSMKPLYNFLSVGWFIKFVRRRSKGLTVTVMKNPATNADVKAVRMSFLAHPATSVAGTKIEEKFSLQMRPKLGKGAS